MTVHGYFGSSVTLPPCFFPAPQAGSQKWVRMDLDALPDNWPMDYKNNPRPFILLLIQWWEML